MRYSEKEARELVIQAGHKLVECGLVARTWGNISARVSDTHFIITPSGLAYDSLTPDKLVLVKMEDCSYTGNIKPSSEKGIHAAAYTHDPDTGFVIHTHQDYASCIGVGGKDLIGLDHPVLGDCVPCAGYGMPSTKNLKKNVEAAIKEHPEAKAIFMKHHGALCIANDFEAAFDIAMALENVCRELYEKSVTIQENETSEFGDLIENLSEKCGALYFSVEQSPEILAVAAMGRTLHPHLDDLAQIAGVTIRCAAKDLNSVLKAFKGRSAVLVPGVGAVCSAEDKSDLAAIGAIMQKSCMTALYAKTCGASPLSMIDRSIMRIVYTMKYSKKKAEK